MKPVIKEYLKKLQAKEAVGGFAIDYFPSGDKNLQRGVFPYKKGSEISKRKIVVDQSAEETPKRILIDLDRVVHKYSKGWVDGTMYDEPVEGAKEALETLKKNGYEIVIFTARICPQNRGNSVEEAKKQYYQVVSWLTKWKIPFDRITCHKLNAVAYIDDRAVPFSSWSQALTDLPKVEEKHNK